LVIAPQRVGVDPDVKRSTVCLEQLVLTGAATATRSQWAWSEGVPPSWIQNADADYAAAEPQTSRATKTDVQVPEVAVVHPGRTPERNRPLMCWSTA
jgi:hypothetical protein